MLNNSYLYTDIFWSQLIYFIQYIFTGMDCEEMNQSNNLWDHNTYMEYQTQLGVGIYLYSAFYQPINILPQQAYNFKNTKIPFTSFLEILCTIEISLGMK